MITYKLKTIFASLLLVAAMTACSSDDDDDVTETVSAPELVSTSPADGETDVDPTITEVTLTFDKNINFVSSNASKITLNDESVSKAQVIGTSPTLTITVELELATTYTLSVPAGLITGPNSTEVGAVSITFTTVSVDISTDLSNSAATDAAKTLFVQMAANYGSKVYSGAMANVNWNYENATQVYNWTGSYPAVNCFDYIHLLYSPANWIDYSDITPVQEWYDAGGIVAAMWHWNVPESEGSDEVNFYASGNSFSVTEALTDGTWENEQLLSDLEDISTHLLLLQDAGIPVLWRPLHEASGAWFWWGAEGSTAFINLWITMYDYFLEKGVNNLIWVWTSCEGTDTDWYPGDDYVDIIGIDLYSQSSASTIYGFYSTLTKQYPDKMIALSECGTVADISDQWSAGCKWLWFMPWYDGDDTVHADSSWWTDAMGQSYVITR